MDAAFEKSLTKSKKKLNQRLKEIKNLFPHERKERIKQWMQQKEEQVRREMREEERSRRAKEIKLQEEYIHRQIAQMEKRKEKEKLLEKEKQDEVLTKETDEQRMWSAEVLLKEQYDILKKKEREREKMEQEQKKRQELAEKDFKDWLKSSKDRHSRTATALVERRIKV